MPLTTVHETGAVLLVVLGLSVAFPSLRVLTTVLYLPLWLSFSAVLLLGTAIYQLAQSDALARAPTLLERQRQALRPLSFTTPSAWSAVLTRHAWESSPPPLPPLSRSSPPELDRAVAAFFEQVRRAFVLPWYERISPSPAFPDAVDELIRSVLADVVKRAETVDWSVLVTSRLVPLLKDHLHHYASIEHLAPAPNAAVSPTSLSLPLPKKAHPALVSTAHLPSGVTPPSVENHLRDWVVKILETSLPASDQSEVVKLLGREVTLCTVLMPVFDMLSDGDFWNQQIDVKGGKYLHEQKQVTRFLSALSAMPSSATPSPRRTRKVSTAQQRRLPPVAAASLITANSSSKDFDAFIRSISRVRTLGEARRLRSDIERELRRAQGQLEKHQTLGVHAKEGESMEKKLEKFVKRLERADSTVEAWITMLSNGQGRSAPKAASTPLSAVTSTGMNRSVSADIDLYAILSDPASLAYWLEHMERRNRSRLVQFWLTVEGFKDPLEAVGRDSALDNALQASMDISPEVASTALEDVKFLSATYFDSSSPITVPARSLSTIQAFVLDADGSRSTEQVQQVRHAVYVSQKAIYEQMEEEDWPAFQESELYRKAKTDITKPATSKPALDISTAIHNPTVSSANHSSRRLPPTSASPASSPVLPGSPLLSRAPIPRPSPLLMHNSGFFTPGTATPSAGITMTPPNFDRRVTEPSKQDKLRESRKVSEGDVDKMTMSVPSLPVTPAPQIPRRSSQLDFLTSAGDLQMSAEDRGKLFEDGDDTLHEEEEDDFEEAERIEAIQAALNEIISDERPPLTGRTSDRSPSETPQRDLDPITSPSASMVLLRTVEESGKMRDKVTHRTRSAEDLQKTAVKKSSISAPQSRLPSLGESNGKLPSLAHRSSLSTMSERPAADLFGDEMANDSADELGGDGDKTQDNIVLPTPGDLQLSVEIARLQDKITELVKQESLLTTLIRQAELTGSQSELRILTRSLSSVRREQRTAIFQKAQFEQQEETNRLVPGRTKIVIPASVITTEDTEGGKNVVRYTIQVQQVAESGEIEASWMVARRYNEFFELDKTLRDLSATDGEKGLLGDIRNAAELPGKKLVIAGGSASFVEGRRLGLERYLQSLLASEAICNTVPLRHFLSRSPVDLPVPPPPQRTNSDPLRSRLPLSSPAMQANGAALNVSAQSLVKTLYKTMATSLDDALLGPNMVDMMYATLTRQINDVAGGVGGVLSIGEELAGYGTSFLPSGLRQLARTDSAPSVVGAAKQLPPPVQPMGGETGLGSFTTPICDLFIELFDLKENNWLRRQAIVVILQQFLGSTIERRVRDTIRALLSPTSFSKIISGLTESLFPEGRRRPSSAPRTPEEMLESKVSASRKLGHLIPDVAAQMIGRGNARRAARRVFGMLQDKRLNQQLLLCIIDEVFTALYPGPQLSGSKA